jgi:hypothetical protein
MALPQPQMLHKTKSELFGYRTLRLVNSRNFARAGTNVRIRYVRVMATFTEVDWTIRIVLPPLQ